MMECYCVDGDAPEVYERSTPVARTQHRCNECRRAIKPGEQYERVHGLWRDSGFETYKTCPRCLSLREYVQAHVPCLCWYHYSLLEDCRDAVQEYAHEAPGLWFGFLRHMVAIISNGDILPREKRAAKAA